MNAEPGFDEHRADDTGRMTFSTDDGLVDVRFSQGEFDWLFLNLRLVPHVTKVTHLDEGFAPVRTETLAPPVFEASCRMSGVYCPLRHMIAWLESLTLGVQECSWSFDGEGPYSRFTVAHGSLVFEGSGAPGEGVSTHVNRHQLVKAFYGALREFAQSRDYDPRPYEVSQRASGPDAVPLVDLRSPMVEQWLETNETSGMRWWRAANPATTVIDAAAYVAERVRNHRRKDARVSIDVGVSLERARVLSEEGAIVDVGVLCAALLHGITVGTRTTVRALEEKFGGAAAGIVRELSPWAMRVGAARNEPQRRGPTGLGRGARLVLLAELVCRQREALAVASRRRRRPAGCDAALAEIRQLVDAIRGTHATLEDTFDWDAKPPEEKEIVWDDDA